MITAKINQEGLANLLQEMRAVPAKTQKVISTYALREGIKEIVKYLGENVPVRTGKLAKSIRLSTFNRPNLPGVRITVGNQAAYYAHIVESGTTRKPGGYWIRPTAGKSLFFKGIFSGAVFHPPLAGTHFVQKSFDQGAEPAVERFAEALDRKLPQELEKLARKGS